MTLDFWDLTMLLVRQWRLALPALLATLVLTVLTLVHVKPYYVCTAYVQLVTPLQAAVPAGETQPTSGNPWLTQTLSTLGNAALVTVQDLTYAHQLKSEGYSDNYTVQLGGSNPLTVLTVTGRSRAQARDTANVIVAHYENSLADLQTSYGVASSEMITGQRLDTGSNITISSGRVKRDLLIVISGGLITATAISLLAELLARRRVRRASERSAHPVLASDAGPSGAENGSVSPVSDASDAAPGWNVAMPVADGPVTASARVPAENRAVAPRFERPVDRNREAATATAAVDAGTAPDETTVIPKIMRVTDK
jgi:hypothetical protein